MLPNFVGEQVVEKTPPVNTAKGVVLVVGSNMTQKLFKQTISYLAGPLLKSMKDGTNITLSYSPVVFNHCVSRVTKRKQMLKIAKGAKTKRRLK